MRKKKKGDEIFDQYAKGYSTGAFAPSRYNRRAGMRFADDINWYFIAKYLPTEKSIWFWMQAEATGIGLRNSLDLAIQILY